MHVLGKGCFNLKCFESEIGDVFMKLAFTLYMYEVLIPNDEQLLLHVPVSVPKNGKFYSNDFKKTFNIGS